jgi:S-(hydroxymethyl)glutathione dehydrogenase/alcohol dehydrogenase
MQAVVWDGEMKVRDDVELRPPRPHEVRVRLCAAGLCHSDLSVLDGTIPLPTPAVLGHEGAGVVVEVGDAARKLQPGDHVVLTTLASCGQCPACARGVPTQCRDTFGRMRRAFSAGGEAAFQFANAGVFAEETVVAESQAVPIDRRVPFEAACLIGCAVLTGAGAVWNRARVQPGQSVLVIGAGGIGLAVVQAARLAAAGTIAVLDNNPAKREIALALGATEFLCPPEGAAAAEALQELGLTGGVDHSFECVGHPALVRQAIDALDWGGTCTLVGVPKLGSEASFVISSLYNDKSVLGCRYGTARPHHDIPLVAGLYLDGRFKLDEMVSRTYGLAGIGEAVDDLRAGRLNRGVLRIAGS